MDMIRRLSNNRLAAGIAGLVLGLIIGAILIGYWLWPARWEQAAPSNLSPAAQQNWLRAAIDSYAANQDASLARERYQVLGAAAPDALAAIQANPEKLDPAQVQTFSTIVAGISPAAAQSSGIGFWAGFFIVLLVMAALFGLIWVALKLIRPLLPAQRNLQADLQAEGFTPIEVSAVPEKAAEVSEVQPFASEAQVPIAIEMAPFGAEVAPAAEALASAAVPEIPTAELAETLPAEDMPPPEEASALEEEPQHEPGLITEAVESPAATPLETTTAATVEAPVEPVSEALVEPEIEVPPVPEDVAPPAPAVATPPAPAEDEQAKMSYNIANVEGIGPVYADKLTSAGAATPKALLQIGGTPKGRADLAMATGISEKLILRWVNHVDLYRIKGIGSEYADLLEAAGVDTVVELATRNPASLYQKLVAINMDKRLVRKVPFPNQVANWITQAKELPRAVSY